MKELLDFTYVGIRNELFRLKSKEMKTNFFITEKQFNSLEKKGYLSVYTTEKGCFIFAKDKDFVRFYFIVSDISALDIALDFIRQEYTEVDVTTEVAGKKIDVELVKASFLTHEFREYSSMVRMSKVRGEGYTVDNEYINLLEVDKKSEIQQLFAEYFDKFVERIPSEEELDDFIENKNIYYFSDDNRIQGFIIFEHQGLTSHLRYWFVHPEYRNKKIGSKLIQLFFTEGKSVKRELFWVIESNSNAIKRYKHFGFVEEDMHNLILINKDKKYEE